MCTTIQYVRENGGQKTSVNVCETGIDSRGKSRAEEKGNAQCSTGIMESMRVKEEEEGLENEMWREELFPVLEQLGWLWHICYVCSLVGS